jgi:hypothetical protein
MFSLAPVEIDRESLSCDIFRRTEGKIECACPRACMRELSGSHVSAPGCRDRPVTCHLCYVVRTNSIYCSFYLCSCLTFVPLNVPLKCDVLSLVARTVKILHISADI